MLISYVPLPPAAAAGVPAHTRVRCWMRGGRRRQLATGAAVIGVCAPEHAGKPLKRHWSGLKGGESCEEAAGVDASNAGVAAEGRQAALARLTGAFH